MALKRKRSDPSVSTSPAPSTTHSSPQAAMTVPSYFPQTKLYPSYQQSPWKQFDGPPSSFELHDHQHPGGRTIKRHRDSRPDDAHVHAATLARLFSAQRVPHTSPPVSPWTEYAPAKADFVAGQDEDLGQMGDEMEVEGLRDSTQTSNLHSYWAQIGDQHSQHSAGASAVQPDDCENRNSGNTMDLDTSDAREGADQRTTLHRFWG